MNCGQPQYIDASLVDLGDQLRKVHGASLPEEGGVSEVAQQVLRFLSEELAGKRWLLVYDNAEYLEEIRRLLPSGGDVLITSRDKAWDAKDQKALPIDVFLRAGKHPPPAPAGTRITEEEADEGGRGPR